MKVLAFLVVVPLTTPLVRKDLQLVLLTLPLPPSCPRKGAKGVTAPKKLAIPLGRVYVLHARSVGIAHQEHSLV